MANSPGDVTQLLLELRHGNREAENQLVPLVYKELRRIATNYLRKESRGHSLQPTALVHEAYLRLTHMQRIDWQSRSHFFAISATLMRRILVDHARAQHRVRRGGVLSDLPLENAMTIAVSDTDFDLLALDEALDRLAIKEENLAKIVELRFFSGL